MVQEAIWSSGMAHSEHVLSECLKNFCSRLQQLPVIIRPGDSGVVASVLTRSEFETWLCLKFVIRDIYMLKQSGSWKRLFQTVAEVKYQTRFMYERRWQTRSWGKFTVLQIGSCHVLIAIVIVQDGSWVKLNLNGELHCLNLYPEHLHSWCRVAVFGRAPCKRSAMQDWTKARQTSGSLGKSSWPKEALGGALLYTDAT